MSAPRITRRTAAFAAAAAVTTTVLFGLGDAGASDLPAVASDACSNWPAHVPQWPGTLGDGSTHSSDRDESCPARPSAGEPQILEFDWRHAYVCNPAREPQILEFDWRHAYVCPAATGSDATVGA